MIGLKKMIRTGISPSFIEDLAMGFLMKRFAQSVTTWAVPSPSSKRLMVISWGDIPTRPGQATKAGVWPTWPSCLCSLAAAFCLPAK